MSMDRKITVLDSTLRDGVQGEGLSFSLQDKLNVLRLLDEFGVDYLEAGNPASNPKDLEFFRAASRETLRHSRLCAFGATRRKGVSAEDDSGLQQLLVSEAPVITLVGKVHRRQAEQILGVSSGELQAMIFESIAFLKRQGREVIFDAEHFFDGFSQDASFALEMIGVARDAGADLVCLCDTNGAAAPTSVFQAVQQVAQRYPGLVLGAHMHNDCGCAVANAMLAVEAGARHVQGTFNGFGERCGNADLSILIPNLLLKKGCICQVEHLEQLCRTASSLAEIANVALPANHPYVGHSAFSHKGGMHADGQLKMPGAFEHISPETVGNTRHFPLSEVAGRAAFAEKVRHFAPHLTKENVETARIMERLKSLEYTGYQFEAADASFELLVRRELGMLQPHFTLIRYKTIGEFPVPDGAEKSSAMIEVRVGKCSEISAAWGNGPIHAMDQALRKALEVFYPQLRKLTLVDYKVRVLDSESATGAKVRVRIDSSDGISRWTTVGVSTDIIEASWLALVDSIEYHLRNVPEA